MLVTSARQPAPDLPHPKLQPTPPKEVLRCFISSLVSMRWTCVSFPYCQVAASIFFATAVHILGFDKILKHICHLENLIPATTAAKILFSDSFQFSGTSRRSKDQSLFRGFSFVKQHYPCQHDHQTPEPLSS